ncbi:hypothetical protein BDR22DRAFT_817585 [Usnea florida]
MSNDIYYQSRTAGIYGGTITLIIVAAIAVALRLTARSISAANLWWDDWTLVIALFLNIALSTGYWIQVSKGGLGRHTTAVGGPIDEQGISNFFKTLLAIQILYFSSAVAIKTSLILLYYRIFGVVRWFRWLLAVAWSVVLLYYVIALFVAVFECTPVPFYWDKNIKGGTCIDQNSFYRWNGVANLLIDFMILSLTMPMVWRLKLEIRQKISLSSIFLLGLFACVASIVRVTAFSQVVEADITYTIVTASIFTVVEQSVGVTCASLPTLGPLILRVRQLSSRSIGTAITLDHEPSSHLKSKPSTIQLKNMRASRPKYNGTGDSRTGFAKLPGDMESGLAVPAEAVVTTHVGTSPSRFDAKGLVGPETILRQQTLEQHDRKIDVNF